MCDFVLFIYNIEKMIETNTRNALSLRIFYIENENDKSFQIKWNHVNIVLPSYNHQNSKTVFFRFLYFHMNIFIFYENSKLYLLPKTQHKLFFTK